MDKDTEKETIDRLERTIRNNNKYKDMTLLNLGCGYTKEGSRVDIKKECNPDLVADICKPLPIDEKFDIVRAMEIIEHVRNPRGVMENMFRHMKDTGYGIISTPNALGYEIGHRFNKKKIGIGVWQYLTPCVIKGLINMLGGRVIYQNFGSRFWLKHIYIIFEKNEMWSVEKYIEKNERDIKIVCLVAFGFVVSVFTYLITKIWL